MTAAPRKATLFRIVMEDHVCPYGIKSKWPLEREGFMVGDHHLTSRAETDRFKAEHEVATTPQTFLGGQRIGGYDGLVAKRAHCAARPLRMCSSVSHFRHSAHCPAACGPG